MKYLASLCAAFIAGAALALPAFGADIGTFRLLSSVGSGNQAGDLYDEIVERVRNDALMLPKNPETCAHTLYAWQNAQEACGDEYARRFSAAEVALMDEEENAPVFGEMRGKIGIIRFSAFGKDTDKNFMERALALREQGAEELRIDLRDNRGGYIDAALKILYLFAGEHDRFVTFLYRTRTEAHDATSVKTKFALWHQPGMLRKVPTAVWINRNSASASEMVAGTMRDWKYAIQGGTSDGKGIGQDFFELSDGSFVRLTVIEFFVGNSQTKIHSVGVIPNAPLPEEARK